MKRARTKTRPTQIAATPAAVAAFMNHGRPPAAPPTAAVTEMPDPKCASACGGCWACMRKQHGPLFFLKGVGR